MPNRLIANENGVARIQLQCGAVIQVDSADLDVVMERSWSLAGPGHPAARPWIDGKRRALYLHCEIAQPAPGKVVFHRNRDLLDCRRENLNFNQRVNSGQGKRPYAAVSQPIHISASPRWD